MAAMAQEHGPNQKHPITLPEAAQELKKMKDIAIPIAVMGLLNYLKGMISVVCMGRLGRLELAGGSLAIGFTNITGYSVLCGLAMGMDPLCSQAFGSRNLSLATLTLRRTITMLLCASIPIGLLWLNLEPLLLALHQKPDITAVASLYCQYALPDLVANSLLQPLKVYLRNESTAWFLMWSTFFSILLHLPITIFLTFILSFRVPGIAIATFITNFNTLIFLLGYMLYAHHYNNLHDQEPSSSSCGNTTNATLSSSSTLKVSSTSISISTSSSLGNEWGTLLRLALPSCLAVCLEWWWYEFMTLLSGYLPKPHIALATSAIVIQTTSLMYILPMALGASVSTRVGNELGASRPSKAQMATTVSMALAVLVSIASLLWTILGRRAWGQVFTVDTEVLELVMAVLPVLGLCELANSPQTTGCGVLRGSARPTVCATINFYSFYLVGAPVALVLGFVMELGFKGLCYALLAAQIACAFSILTVVWKTDWAKESSKAKELVGREESLKARAAIHVGEEMEFLKEIGSIEESGTLYMEVAEFLN